MIVFCSDSHTAKGHVAIGNSAQRLLEGGRTAVAIAPVDLAERDAERRHLGTIVAVGDGDGGARETARVAGRGAGRRRSRRSSTTTTGPARARLARARPSRAGSRSAPRPAT